jgi:hypothetical protein
MRAFFSITFLACWFALPGCGESAPTGTDGQSTNSAPAAGDSQAGSGTREPSEDGAEQGSGTR